MDAITLLKNDHKTVEELFKRFERAGERAHVQKRQIVDRIIEDLSVHAAIEEQVFYPVARASVPQTEDIVLESLEEHHIVKWVLSELVDLEPTDERFDAKVTVLMENVRHHVKEEEGEFFPQVRNALSRAELAELGDALATAKKSAPTRPHPRASDVPPGNAVAGALAGAMDRVNDNLSGLKQGGRSAVQDLVARITGSPKHSEAPTGSTVATKRAKDTRATASAATTGAVETARSVKAGATKTARAAKSGAKSTATSAKRSARTTRSTAKRAATTTARTAKSSAKSTASTARRAAKSTKAAATSK